MSDYDFTNNTAIDYEKESYEKLGYKRVQRLRRKGRNRGIEVPPLGYVLTKPEKKRLPFTVAAICGAIIFAAMIVLTIILFNFVVKTVSDLDGTWEMIKLTFDPDTLKMSFGVSALGGFLLFLVYILIALIFFVPLAFAISFWGVVRDLFYMAGCSKEEFANGELITSRIINFIITLIAATVMFIILLMLDIGSTSKIILAFVYVGFVLVFGGTIVLMILEKSKCKAWFATIDGWKQENYLNHARALRRVNSRLKMERNMWSGR